MADPSIPTRVKRTVAEIFSQPVKAVTPESSPDTIEGWDSVGHLNLVLALEQEFRVQFSPDDIEKMLTVQQIVQVLEHRASEASPEPSGIF